METDTEAPSLRARIDEFIAARLQAKLDKLKPDQDAERQALVQQYERNQWLDDAARRAAQLTLVSHTVKPINADARGTQPYLRVPLVANEHLVGTHTLAREQRVPDVVGNAAALDVYKLLKIEAAGYTLLQGVLDGNADTLAALSHDAATAQRRAQGFARIAEGAEQPASHALAKQLYFPLPDGSYHLLAPLYSSPLAHAIHAHLQESRFSESVKEARKARADRKAHPHGYRDYPNLLQQSFGGSKPQNISQLNSERGGRSYLFSGLPPRWRSADIKPALRQRSVFDARRGQFANLATVRELSTRLRDFLHTHRGSRKVVEVRDCRAELVDHLIDELLAYGDRMRTLEPGWSSHDDCELSAAEKRWLDPAADRESVPAFDGLLSDDTELDWASNIANRFARWLNVAISTKENVMEQQEGAEWERLLQRSLRELAKELADE